VLSSNEQKKFKPVVAGDDDGDKNYRERYFFSVKTNLNGFCFNVALGRYIRSERATLRI